METAGMPLWEAAIWTVDMVLLFIILVRLVCKWHE